MTSSSSRRRRTLVWGAIPVVLLGAAVSVTEIPGTDINLAVPYAAEGPGPTVNTLDEVDGKPVVEVDAPNTDDPAGHLNMTTVSVRTQMSLMQMLGRWLTSDDTIVPIETVIPKNMSPEQMEEANKQAFTDSESAATIAAMDYLDKPVEIVVADLTEDSVAQGALEREDVIKALDGEAVGEPQELQKRIQSHAPGDEVTLTVERDGKEREEKVTLAASPHDEDVPLLGILMTTQPAEDIKVNYNLQDIGGPSAGMMFSLAVIDKLSPGDLTGGHFVAGTGTIGPDAKVGPIGGIVHKVDAAEEAGAELFLAPSGNCAEATSRDHGDMVIASVDTLDDAIAAMDDFDAGRDVKTCPAQ
ncbi:YlbL family protein [Corynebacterium sp. 32222D000AT]|uniref:YlbL family protein n=1 Tax=unclassified Corynebacterium TaxID=2624378 RepID=UPI0034CDFECA